MLHLPMCAALPPPKGASPLAALVMRSKHSLVRNPDWVGSAVDQGRRCISAAGRHRFKQHLPAGEDELKPAAGNFTPPLPRLPSPLPPPPTHIPCRGAPGARPGRSPGHGPASSRCAEEGKETVEEGLSGTKVEGEGGRKWEWRAITLGKKRVSCRSEEEGWEVHLGEEKLRTPFPQYCSCTAHSHVNSAAGSGGVRGV